MMKKFFDGLADELDQGRTVRKTFVNQDERPKMSAISSKSSKAAETPSNSSPTASKTRRQDLVHDAVVEVMISSQYTPGSSLSSGKNFKSLQSDNPIQAKMIISIWTTQNHRFYTLSFTSASNTSLPPSRPQSRTFNRKATQASLGPSSTSTPSSSNGSGQLSNDVLSSVVSPQPMNGPLSVSPFPPLGAPSRSNLTTTPSVLQKTLRMKDAIINGMELPAFAMWEDESLAFYNKAIKRLMQQATGFNSDDVYDLLSRFKVYTEDFERALEIDEFPIVQLCRTRKPFEKWRIGVIDMYGKRLRYDLCGEGIFDEKTGEFMAGMVVLKDVTEYTEIIKTQSEENERQFEMICHAMPQMVGEPTTSSIVSY